MRAIYYATTNYSETTVSDVNLGWELGRMNKQDKLTEGQSLTKSVSHDHVVLFSVLIVMFS